jgi:hypothetical protein
LNDALDFSHPVTVSSNEFLPQTATDHVSSIISAGGTVSLGNSTHSLNTTPLPSTDNEYNHFDYREPTPPHEQVNKITNINSIDNATKSAFLKNDTKLIVDWSNKTHILRKTSRTNKHYDMFNATIEEAAQRSAERKIMQSLLHLIPPNLWSQIRNNRSLTHQNQTQYKKPFLPNPVLLAEAAAKAGLPGPGPYPIPEHLWYRYPPPIITRLATTCKFILE